VARVLREVDEVRLASSTTEHPPFSRLASVHRLSEDQIWPCGEPLKTVRARPNQSWSKIFGSRVTEAGLM
jgi:hypothetical protein